MEKFTSDAIVIAEENPSYILLIERKNPPFKGSLAFPGGFIDDGEDPYEAALRELKEETSLNLENIQGIPLSIRKKDGRDPRGKTLTHPYLFQLKKRQVVRAQDDAANAFWLPLNEVSKMAFDHGAILCEALSKFWKGMPSYSKELRPLTELPSGGELILFGGTFNPIHEGHLECIKLVKDKNKNSKIMTLPDYNPQKDMPEHICFWKYFKNIQDRFNELDILTYPGFTGMESSNPTYFWLKDLSLINPNLKLSLLIGEDTFNGLNTWIESEKLFKLIKNIYVVPRNGTKSDDTQNWLKKINPNINIEFLPNHKYENISSTNLRNSIAQSRKD